MNKSIIVLALTFAVLLGLGTVLAKKNTVATAIPVNGKDSTTTVEIANMDTTKFVMPEFDEEAIMAQEQQQMLQQMNPAQRAEYQRQYIEYMQQMQMQEEYLRQKAEYEKQMENGGVYVPPVSEKTQSKIDKLKEKFRQKQIQDSINALIKAPVIK